MARVFIPSQLRELSHGAKEAAVEADNVRQLVLALDARFPGMKNRLQSGENLAAGVAVSIDGVAQSQGGLLAKLKPDSEVHFSPALSGG
ncbi:MAG: MoaD/ThiS family protein [Planctomycetales bacterium]